MATETGRSGTMTGGVQPTQFASGWRFLPTVVGMAAVACVAVLAGAASSRPAPAPQEASSTPFSDVPAGHWAAEAVAVLAQHGITNGYPDGTYRGGQAITRFEVALAVQRLLQEPLRTDPSPLKHWPKPEVLYPPPTDVPHNHWAWDAVDWRRELGI